MTNLQGSKCLLISWLQSPSAVILEPPQNKVSTVKHILILISSALVYTDCGGYISSYISLNSTQELSNSVTQITLQCNNTWANITDFRRQWPWNLGKDKICLWKSYSQAGAASNRELKYLVITVQKLLMEAYWYPQFREKPFTNINRLATFCCFLDIFLSWDLKGILADFFRESERTLLDIDKKLPWSFTFCSLISISVLGYICQRYNMN